MTETKTKTKTEKVTDKVIMNKETKEQKFNRLGSERQGRVIDRLAMLGRIADNPQNYDFDEEKILILFAGIEEFTAKMKQRFLDCISAQDVKEEYKVSL